MQAAYNNRGCLLIGVQKLCNEIVHSKQPFFFTKRGSNVLSLWMTLSSVIIQNKATEHAILSCGAVYYAAQGVSYFYICGPNPQRRPFK